MRKDKITLKRIELLHPKVREEVRDIYDEICIRVRGNAMCRFTYTLRTFAEQDAIYAQGRTKPGPIVTKSKSGQSAHNYGLAVDIVLIHEGKAIWNIKNDYDKDGIPDWMEVVRIFKSYGWEWGGDWKFTDNPHFQKMMGLSIKKCLALHQANKVDEKGFIRI
jgi:peptidoglycan L-alanyl-D-glutamate endopeptidase CwlK